MIKYKIIFYKSVMKLLAVIGIAVGISGCNPNDNSGGVVAMYGAPSENYSDVKFFGTVKSADSLKAIPAVRVTLIDQYYHDSIYTNTNTAGEFTFYKDATTDRNFTIRFKITDPVQSHGNFKAKKVDFVVNFRDVNNKEKQINTDLIRN